MLVNARIGLEKKEDALLVPVAAIVKEKVDAFVFAVVKSKAQKKPVQTGFNDGTHIEIAHGLTSDDLVILTGQQVLRDGQPIKGMDAK
jgi:membrane fusion protein (multidrug efflux system)